MLSSFRWSPTRITFIAPLDLPYFVTPHFPPFSLSLSLPVFINATPWWDRWYLINGRTIIHQSVVLECLQFYIYIFTRISWGLRTMRADWIWEWGQNIRKNTNIPARLHLEEGQARCNWHTRAQSNPYGIRKRYLCVTHTLSGITGFLTFGTETTFRRATF